jgi:hypothetical protein
MKGHFSSQPFQCSFLVVALISIGITGSGLLLSSSASIAYDVSLSSSASGYTGGEIVIKLSSAHFAPLNGTTNYQVKVDVNYSVSDPALIGQKINAIMKVYSSNGSLLKTTSFPAGFTANNTGMTQLLTNIPISTAQNITTETVFTDVNKTSLLSNPVKTLPTISNPIKSSEFTPTVIGNKTNP